MSSRRGLSLLEVVLALALAAIAISLLGQLVNIGNRAAAAARDLSKAQLIAQSIMSETTSGISDPVSTSGTYEADPMWNYEITVAPNSTATVNIITVTVTHNVEGSASPATFALTQWLLIPIEEEEETIETEDGAA